MLGETIGEIEVEGKNGRKYTLFVATQSGGRETYEFKDKESSELIRLDRSASQVLRELSESVGCAMTLDELHARVWGGKEKDKARSDVNGALTRLRHALKYSKEDENKFIRVQGGSAFLLKKPVMKGDFPRLTLLSNWPLALNETIGTLKSTDCDIEGIHVRLLTVAFNPEPSKLGVDDWVQSGLNLRVILLDPNEKELINSHFLHRTQAYRDKTVLPHLRIKRSKTPNFTEQFEYLDALNEIENDPTGYGREAGRVEIKLAKKIPCGFVALTRFQVLFAAFPAYASYAESPIIRASRHSKWWEMLDEDFRTRWEGSDFYSGGWPDHGVPRS
jgi:hypothetical protein